MKDPKSLILPVSHLSTMVVLVQLLSLGRDGVVASVKAARSAASRSKVCHGMSITYNHLPSTTFYNLKESELDELDVTVTMTMSLFTT